MARSPTLSFDRGTLILHPPPPGKAWIDYADLGRPRGAFSHPRAVLSSPRRSPDG